MTTPDFSRIWAEQSPLNPYEFSDHDYLTGWASVGEIPPDRRMFDAWQKAADMKMGWLYGNGARKEDLIALRAELITLIRTSGGGGHIGDIIPSASNGPVPSDCLLCDGSAVSRELWAELFAAVGTTYGAGDGSTTFNVPLIIDGRFLEGGSIAGTYKDAGLPNIYGTFGQLSDCSASGVFRKVGGCYEAVKSGNSTSNGIEFNAARYSSIYGASTTVQPKSLTVRYLIKATGSTSGGGGGEDVATDEDVQDMLDDIFG